MEDYRISHITFGINPEPMTQEERITGQCSDPSSPSKSHCECWWDGNDRCCHCKKTLALETESND